MNPRACHEPVRRCETRAGHAVQGTRPSPPPEGSAHGRQPHAHPQRLSPALSPLTVAAGMALLGASLLGTPAQAQETNVQPGLHIRPHLELEAEARRNRRLASGDIRQDLTLSPMGIVALRWQSEGRWALVNETELRVDHEHETEDGNHSRGLLKINQLYAEGNYAEHDALLRIGRWKVKDERKFMFDQELDGVWASHERGPWEFQAFLGREDHLPRDLLHTDSKGDGQNYLGFVADYELARRRHITLNGVVRRNGEDNARMNHISIGAHAMPKDDSLRHWAVLSLAQGHLGGNKYSGHAIDLGATLRISPHEMKPRLTVGYAWGSGHGSSERGTNGTHLQTGLHDNESNFGGQADFDTYGVVLDPDLSNIHILTAGIGINPDRQTSWDLVYHYYRQDKTAGLNHTNMRPRFDDESARAIGHGLDLVWGWRPDSRWRFEAAVGMFEPNARFRDSNRAGAGSAKTAFKGWLEVKYYFDAITKR